MRLAEDVRANVDYKHDSKTHDLDTQRAKNAPGVSSLNVITKVDVQEIIKPNDPRYLNQWTWVRGVVNDKVLYVDAYGLRNTSY